MRAAHLNNLLSGHHSATMDSDKTFTNALKWKSSGGVQLDVFVSDGIWLGGMLESRPHEPFVAVGPSNWDCEDELSFFSSRSEVELFIEKLRSVAESAFAKD